MPHLDLIALREPVTCRLPTDPEKTRRPVTQFVDAQIRRYKQALARLVDGDESAAIDMIALLREAVPSIGTEDIEALGMQDMLRILGAAQAKSEMVEAALKNVRSDGGSSSPTEPPSRATPDSTTTTNGRPRSRGSRRHTGKTRAK